MSIEIIGINEECIGPVALDIQMPIYFMKHFYTTMWYISQAQVHRNALVAFDEVEKV